ncbi:EpsG family protein [Chryseobacterium sp. APV1]|uniref:EpsG family protein n=1 Tax=Chryseobacterium urinae TaxID=3058400 RepID=A0ABT8U9D4_9FLAO|nr:EpsG family protein [Chryseobacterium sp. APV1]MDO3426248.1 EpsG family protein [Chryseobacterium sp. APV1]
MEIYFFTIFFLAFFSLIELNIKDVKGAHTILNTLKFLSFTVLVGQMGLRWETGTDWPSYYDHYESFRNENKWFSYSNQMDLGYNLLTHFFYKYFYGYSLFLFFNAFVFYAITFKSLEFLSKYFFITLLIFYCLFMGNWGTNRQLLALAFGLYSLKFLLEKRYVYYFLLVIMGYFFHSTSLLFFLYFFINREIKDRVLLILLVASIAISYSPLPVYLFGLVGGFNENVSTKAGMYLRQAQEETAILSTFGLIKRLSFVLIFFIARKHLQKKIPQYNLIFNGYFLGILFYFIFGKSLLVMVSRGSMYFNAMEPLLLGFLLLLVDDKKKRMMMIFPLFVIAIINFNQSISVYKDIFNPYKGIFYNEEYRRVDF